MLKIILCIIFLSIIPGPSYSFENKEHEKISNKAFIVALKHAKDIGDISEHQAASLILCLGDKDALKLAINWNIISEQAAAKAFMVTLKQTEYFSDISEDRAALLILWLYDKHSLESAIDKKLISEKEDKFLISFIEKKNYGITGICHKLLMMYLIHQNF